MNHRQKILAMLAAVAGILASTVACNQHGEKIIENPRWQAANARGFDITRITLTDTATVVNIDAYADPHLWIRWDTTTYLKGDGKKYMIKRAEGIELCAEHFVPESGKDSFVFYFEPIDPSLKTIDLIEGDYANYFKIWGIDLRGGKSVEMLSKQIPAEVRATDFTTATLPEPEFKNGMSSLRVKVIGYRPEMEYSPDLTVFSMIPHPKDTYLPTEVASGEWLFELPVFGLTPARLQLSRMMTFMDIMLEPGADNTVWIDLAAWSNKVAPDDPATTWAWSDGRYAAFDMVYANTPLPFGDYRISFNEPMLRRMVDVPKEELFPMMKAKRDELLAEIETIGLSPTAKELLKYYLKSGYIENISQLGFQIAYQYARDNNIEWGREVSEKMTPKFTPDDYRVAYEGIDFDDPYLIYGMWYYRAYDFMIHNPEARAASGVDGTRIADYLAVKEALQLRGQTPTIDPADPDAEKKKAAWDQYIQSVFDRFDAISDPFILDALALREQYLEKLKRDAASAEGVNVREVPAELDTFEKIIAKYKGSPVLVDLWATWCGPCMMAMRDQRETKAKLMEEGVVFVYITGETSPKQTWETTIPDIKGEHYYLTDAQWRELYRKFNVDGIPFYIMVQRDGTYKADTNMRSLGVWESTIRAALEKNN